MDTTHRSGAVSLTTPSLIGIIVLAVFSGFILTVGLQWLCHHALYRASQHTSPKTGDFPSSTDLGSLHQTQNRWRWHSGNIEENTLNKPSSTAIAADKTSRSMQGIRPRYQSHEEEEDRWNRSPEPLNSARSEKPSTIQTSASSDFRPLRRDTIQDLKVQPSAFHRWSIESAEALRKSRAISKIRRQSLRNSSTSNKFREEGTSKTWGPEIVYDPEKGLPDVHATFYTDSKVLTDPYFSSVAGEQDSQVNTPPDLRPGSYYRPWRLASSALLQITNGGSKTRVETPTSSRKSQDDHPLDSKASSDPEDTSASFGHRQEALPQSLRVSSYYPLMASTLDFESENVKSGVTPAAVHRSTRDVSQPLASLRPVLCAASPGSSRGLRLEQVAGGAETARTYRCWDETFRLSDYD